MSRKRGTFYRGFQLRVRAGIWLCKPLTCRLAGCKFADDASHQIHGSLSQVQAGIDARLRVGVTL